MKLATRNGIYELPEEVVSRICWNVISKDRDGRVSPSTLLSFARTGRFLSEPALDVIWHTLPSIWPLLLLLPEDLRVLHRIKEAGRKESLFMSLRTHIELDFRRPPTTADFTSWIKHAARVRRVSGRCLIYPAGFDTPTPILTPAAVNALQAHFPAPFLPYIRALDYHEDMFARNGSDSIVLPAAAHFSRTLKTVSLHLALHPDPDHLQDIVRSLSLIAPRLETLSLQRHLNPFWFDYRTSTKYWPTLRGVEACRLSCLTSFDTMHMFVSFDALLGGLGKLPHLRRLRFQPSTDPSDWAYTPLGRRDGFFARLEDLTLTWESEDEGNHQGCIDFVSAIAPTALRTISLDLRWPTNGKAEELFTALCAALGSLPCPDTVESITITLGTVLNSLISLRYDENIYHSPCFEPLLKLTALQRLSVRGGVKVVVDDAMLASMANAWPYMRALTFQWPKPADSEHYDSWDEYVKDCNYRPPRADAPDCPRATLAGIVPLVLHCAHLKELEVAVDMRIVPNLDGHRRPPIFLKDPRLCRVKKLCTVGCVPGDEWAAASFLSLLLPQLDDVEFTTPHSNWERIMKYYERLRALRGQERRWANRNGKTIKDPLYS